MRLQLLCGAPTQSAHPVRQAANQGQPPLLDANHSSAVCTLTGGSAGAGAAKVCDTLPTPTATVLQPPPPVPQPISHGQPGSQAFAAVPYSIPLVQAQVWAQYTKPPHPPPPEFPGGLRSRPVPSGKRQKSPSSSYSPTVNAFAPAAVGPELLPNCQRFRTAVG